MARFFMLALLASAAGAFSTSSLSTAQTLRTARPAVRVSMEQLVPEEGVEPIVGPESVTPAAAVAASAAPDKMAVAASAAPDKINGQSRSDFNSKGLKIFGVMTALYAFGKFEVLDKLLDLGGVSSI